MEGIGMFPYQLLEEEDLVALKRTEKSLVLDDPLLKNDCITLSNKPSNL